MLNPVGAWWPSGKVPVLEPEGFKSPYSTEDPPRARVYVTLVHVKSDIVCQTSFRFCGTEFGEEVSAQMSSSSTDSDSNYEVLPKITTVLLLNGTSI
ncbi:hypothetical protein AVEN_44379-1 [Araneus ventricosus]|uniref:Uncharacterized protein n=1 Tax=Araneus ventricosus TaxID=182803 RepID=A0A4Y2QRC9_ARAVE|nr:hypothetical protein AVEN_44379-1 [Araneus ventricosus]